MNTEKLQPSVPVSNETLQLVVSLSNGAITVMDTLGRLVDKIKALLIEFRRDRIVESVDKINEIIIHRNLMQSLKHLGLGEDWIKHIFNERKNFIWLKNVEGAYVAINQKMFDALELKSYSQILGSKADEVRSLVPKKYRESLSNTHLTDGLVLQEGLSIVNVTKLIDLDTAEVGTEHLKILKYAIKNADDEIIAIFGIGKLTNDEERGLITVDNPEEHIISFLKIIEETK